MKKITKLLAAVLVLGLTLAAFTSCKKETANSATDIEISFWEGSFGVDYMKAIVSEFNSDYPEYKVNLRTSKNADTVANTLQKGQNDTTDIYMNQNTVFINYTDLFMDLSEIASEKIDGENKSIAEKYDPSLFNSLKDSNGDLKKLGWAGSVTGFIYNADIIDGKNYTEPRTTDELADLVNDLQGSYKDKKVFVQFKDARMGYYPYLVKAWMAQYCGLDYYNNNWLTLTDESGKSPSKEVYLSETDGRKQALEVLGSILSDKTILEKPEKFEVARRFKLDEGIMMANGNWVLGEVAELKDKNIKMMRTPVISALADKLETVSDDDELKALVSAIDNVLDNGAEVSLTGKGYDVSEEDWNRVYTARTTVYHNGSEHAMIVNKYTNAKEGVKKFIKFYYSDKGLVKFINATHSAANANLIDSSLVSTNGWTNYEKTQYKRSFNSVYVTDGNAVSPVFGSNATLHMYGTVDIVGALTNSNKRERKNAAELWEELKKNVNASTGWTAWLKSAGIE